jgi:hypothetical protein
MRWFILILICCSCSKSKDVRVQKFSLSPFENTQNYFKATKKLVVDVIYESGQAPYTNLTIQGSPLWQLTEENIAALYLGRKVIPELVIPKELTQMKEISVQNKKSWTAQDLINLAQEHRTGQSSEELSHFVVLFVAGYFNNGSQDFTNTIGISLGGTTIVAIFKDVVKTMDTGLGNPLVPKYLEQATVIHELGHALGLVDNGLPMHEPHKDPENGPHCENQKCVMYWMNEGHQNLRQFVIRMINEGSVIMFDEQCLNDTRKF